ncbi:leucyl aminopeptidase [Marasmius fiardii PR-910]|nr:leucyl aminopeptidase [Marasmius fiardii PR-910]
MSTSELTVAGDEYRLPTNVKPTHYELTVRTDLDKLAFDGIVKVSLDVNEHTDTIVLDAIGLKLGQASVIYDANKDLPIVEIEHVAHEKDKRVAFKFPVGFQVGSKIQFRLDFSGEILDNHVGYNRCSWEHEGKLKYFALTQFSPIDARRGFPCWDEPQLKATYSITLVSKLNTMNLSNMSVRDEKTFSIQEHPELGKAFQDLDSQWKVTRFETTPPMSTYIVAYANGEFSYLETWAKMPLSGKTIPLRIYGKYIPFHPTPDLIHQTEFALELKSKVLPLCEKIFDVEYPLPKLDSLVVPNFAGAMELWGLIMGESRAFLLDPKGADIGTKMIIIFYLTHEISHIRFGNITTMKWWDYLYLNEGEIFCPVSCKPSFKVMDRLYPELKHTTGFINRHLVPAMTLDAKLSSHPIEVPCPDAELTHQLFDALSYSKAASVLRMLAAYVGTERFLRGVSMYLKQHLYGSTETRDLWDGISEATGLNIPNLMDNWVLKTGFPVLIVKEVDGGILVRQERFLETGLAEGKDNETIWNVPLGILSIQSDGTPSIDNSLVLEEREKMYALDTSRPFKLNAGTNGVYRVLYSEVRMKKIASELSKTNSVFTAEDRLGFINDALALSKASLMKLSDSLTLIDAIRGETEFYIWSGISTGLSDITSVWWEHAKIREGLKAFRCSLFLTVVKRLGYVYSSSESPDITQLRTAAIEQCVYAGEKSVVAELKSRFKHYMNTGDDSRIPPDLQKATFIAAVMYGGRDEYNAVKKILDKPRNSGTMASAVYALTSTPDAALINECLQYTFFGANDEDVPFFFRGFSDNGDARKWVVEFFKQNYDNMCKRFVDTYYFKGIIESALSKLSSESDLRDLIRFFDGKDTSKYSMLLAQTLDSIRGRIVFIKHSSEDLEKWLGGPGWKTN